MTQVHPFFFPDNGDEGDHGPLLREVLQVQHIEEALTRYPAIEDLAQSLATLSDALDSPLIWPVGPAAERLAGAAVLVGRGALRIRGWGSMLGGERVLVVALVAAGPLSVLQAVEQAYSMGAVEVHSCGVDVAGIEAGPAELVQSFTPLAEGERSVLPSSRVKVA